MEEQKIVAVDSPNWLGENDLSPEIGKAGLLVESRDRTDLKAGKDQK